MTHTFSFEDRRSGAERGYLLGDISFSAIVCLVLSAFTYWVLQPKFGFDDANITLNYAENIARGLGYVYFEGGERVEGSTSALWTLYVSLAFVLFERPEPFLGLTGVVITFGIVLLSIRIARILLRLMQLDMRFAAPFVAVLFALFPAFFDWSVWSFMDAGLWFLTLTALIHTGLRLIEMRSIGTGDGPVLGFAALSALVTVSRPEGVVVGVGCSLVLLGVGWMLMRPRIIAAPLLGMAASLAAFAALVGLRIWYFGYPHPNTYYAKVSTDFLPQVIQGAHYTKSYLMVPGHLLVIALAALGLLRLRSLSRHTPAYQASLSAVLLIALTVAGGVAVYTALGGDHFSAHRFYQVFLPLLIPAATVLLTMVAFSSTGVPSRGVLGVLGVSAVLGGIYQWNHYTTPFGNNAGEYRIAEGGREVGRRLNDLPGQPGVAIFVAGGVAMTYDGPIYDLMGLNWVEMAHTERNHRGRYTNHGGFSKEVFYRTLPDIVTPEQTECTDTGWTQSPFINRILGGLYSDPEFTELYTLDCWNGLTFYRRKAFELPGSG